MNNQINSLNDLMRVVRESKNEIPEIWYRGQSNSDYKLCPSLLRYSNGLEKEWYIFETYRKFAQNIQKSHNTEWELLIDMQHYFVPTRILDWSESLGIALFFAVQNHKKGVNAGLFLLDPNKLNAKSSKRGIPCMPDNPMNLSYKRMYIDHDPYPVPHPIAIKSNYSNARVLAQRGMFTIHNDSRRGIEEMYPDVVTKYIITEEAVPEVQEFLDIANINVSTIFPDFYGVANYIKDTLNY